MSKMNKVDSDVQAKCCGGTAPDRPIVSCDQEVWVRNRILTVIRMTLELNRGNHVGADGPLLRQALVGLAQGASVEIIHTLDMEPGYVNLPRVPAEI